MKVMIATAYYHPRLGGLENYASAVASGLRDLGWDVVVVCGDVRKSKVENEIFNGYTVWRLPIWKIVSNTPVHPAWHKMIRQIIEIERPDVINAHTPVPYMVDIVSIAARQVPVIVTYHASTLLKKGGLLMYTLTYAYQAIETVTLKRASAIIAVSPYVKTALGKRLASKTEVVPNSVSLVSSLRHSGGEGLVFVANLEPSHAWKGLDPILDSLVIARNKYGVAPHLTVIGDGADRDRYEQRVRTLNLVNLVNFTGELTGTKRDDAVRKAAAQLVYPTSANDGIPTVLLEGWAQGLPVIAADIGPISAVVDHGKTGILVTPNSPVALANAIYAVLTDRDEAEEMGETARRMIEQEYTWPRQVEHTARLFSDLVRASKYA
jgi:glycosyltransferase involved in cell wall biosynthesis